MFEYILLLSAFALSFWYKIAFWAEIFSRATDKGKSYVRTLRDNFFHFWVPIEMLLLFLCFVLFFDPAFEVLLYNFVLYYALLYSVFVLGKIFRGKFPDIKYKLLHFLVLLSILALGYMIFSVASQFGYVYVMSIMLGGIMLLESGIYFLGNKLGKK